MIKIPKNMGHIWIGPRQPPIKWMDTWRDKHPDWHYTIYDNDFLTSQTFINQHLIVEYFRRKQYAGVADLMRYEILWKIGGLIPPADSICLRSTNELFTKPTLYTVYESESLRPGFVSPFLASIHGHPFLRQTIKRLNRVSIDKIRAPWRTTGNKFLARFISRKNPEITIFPSHYFIPTHYSQPEVRYNGPDPIFCEQMWGSTTNAYDAVVGSCTVKEDDVWQATLEKLEARL